MSAFRTLAERGTERLLIPDLLTEAADLGWEHGILLTAKALYLECGKLR